MSDKCIVCGVIDCKPDWHSSWQIENAKLKSRLAAAERERDQLRVLSTERGKLIEAINEARDLLASRCAELEEGLRKLEWWIIGENPYSPVGQPPYHYCMVCGGCKESDDSHDEDCWLAKLLEGEE